MTPTDWSIQRARDTYGIRRWGLRYFDIDDHGRVTVSPLKEQGAAIPIVQVVEEALEQGLHFPMIIRFQDLLRNRVERINHAFTSAMEEFGYQGGYQGVYPIKVNQLREVVEEVIDAGAPFHYGLEVGSKPELFAALAIHEDDQALIVCNGYKDTTYVRTALIGAKLGKKVILVIEKLEELDTVVQEVVRLGVRPLLGVRLRLATRSVGKWAGSSGEDAKFGLSTGELVAVSRRLHQEGMADCLRLVHFHIGSQVPDIMAIKKAVREAAMYYARLRDLGHDLGYLDVGGGLGVDYDGSRTTFHSSANYSLNEYARDIVYNVMDVCESQNTPPPVIVNESGRAIVAHHSVLVVETFSNIKKVGAPPPTPPPNKLVEEAEDILAHLGRDNALETYHDALQVKEEAQARFALGLLGLPEKAAVEHAFWTICERVQDYYQDEEYVPDEIDEIKRHLSDQYLCNFSVFQSMLDHWGLGQLFPIMPLHRLDEEPRRNGTLVDITCDSDGRVASFIDLYGEGADTLPLHDLNGEPYYLGIFLTGAYQDIMGDLHNLFGRVNEAHVFLDDDEESGYYIEEIIEGTTLERVLSLVQYGEDELKRRMKRQFDRAIREDRLRPNEGMALFTAYSRGLKGYTYLDLASGDKN